MTTNFDKNFESHKSLFKQKYGIDWKENLELYTQFLQTSYIATLTEIVNNGLSQVLTRQREIQESINALNNKLSK